MCLLLLPIQLLALIVSPLPVQDSDEEPAPRGVIVSEIEKASPGFTLISPFSSKETFLIDFEGRVRHRWESQYEPGLSAYLLSNGDLLRGMQTDAPTLFAGGGISGGVQRIAWDGTLLWEYHLSNDRTFHHHDLEELPNGNILMIAWEYKSKEEARLAGRDPDQIHDKGLWPDMVLEIEPLPPHGARVVWEWHAWDHLIQDFDESLPNYGRPIDHPERMNINGDLPPRIDEEERAALEALGYLVGSEDEEDDDGDQEKPPKRADWLHMNAVEYNSELDQIALSSFYLSEIWIIDHSTTTEEAKGSTGGRSGRGGDILYRWGNPQIYDAGDKEDRQLFFQHDVQWIPKGYPGEGNLTVFNNGRERPGEEYSTVIEITPPLKEDGTYAHDKGQAYGPAEPTWAYDPPNKQDRFLASFISGAHRLQNGNTLICDGPKGRLLEVDRSGNLVWQFNNSFGDLPEEGPPEGDFHYSMFRGTRIPTDHPALQGRDLSPLDPQPLTTAQLLEENPIFPQDPWVSLIDIDEHWVNVNCDNQTFETKPNPDNPREPMIVSTGKPTGIFRSQKMYENFIVEMQWRHMEEPSNSGFFIWADPEPALGGPFTRGIEVQICNLGNGDWFTSHGDIFPIWGSVMTPDPQYRISGSRSMPEEDAFHVRPTGKWNHYRITAIDGAVQLEVNGHLVSAGFDCRPKKGYLCLESEGGEVHFRNLRIWELPPGSEPANKKSTAMKADDKMKPIYNGLDTEEWEILEGEWKPNDWRLTSDGGPAKMRMTLPASWTRGSIDFKRDAEAAPLPFQLGATSPEIMWQGEKRKEWNRASFFVDGDEIVLEMGKTQMRIPKRHEDKGLCFNLVDHGVPTNYANLILSYEEESEDSEESDQCP